MTRNSQPWLIFATAAMMNEDLAVRLLDLVHDTNQAIGRMSTRLDRHIEQTDIRLKAAEIALNEEKKRTDDWPISYVMSLPELID